MKVNVPLELIMIFKALIASILGGLIGWQREYHGRSAGIRTFAAVTLGACTFGLISTFVHANTDVTRIASQVVTGIGFLGAGVILRKEEGHVAGLTTAASLWAAAAVGLAVAYDMYFVALFNTVLLIVILLLPHPQMKDNSVDSESGNGKNDPIHNSSSNGNKI